MRLLALLAVLWAGAAAAGCRQALVLGLDISASVDDVEYALQLSGVAGALTDPEVQAALFAIPGEPVDLSVFEWSGAATQRIVLRWTTLNGPADLRRAVATIAAHRRQAAETETAVGSAMQFGAALLADRKDCPRHTLDLSGDGRSNAGPLPQQVRDGVGMAWVTVNGLVIGDDAVRPSQGGDLAGYYRAFVIRGPGAFVEPVAGFSDYQPGLKRKLLRELQVFAVSQADAGTQ